MPTGLIRRGGRYSIRRVIPLDLQAEYGRREIVRALGTADPREARRLHAVEWVELDNEFAAKRGAKGSKRAVVAPTKWEPFASQAEQDAMEEASRALSEWADDPLSQRVAEAVRSARVGWEDELREARRLSAQQKAVVRSRSEGVSLSAVVDRWAAELRPTARTAGRTRNIADRFVAVTGVSDVGAITRQHVMQFKDRLIADGQSAANINVMLPMLGTVFNYAVANDLIPLNPAAKVKVADSRRAKEKRRAFTEAEIAAIFSSPIYTEGQRPAAGGGEAAYWLPLLALYSGARQTELGQLHPDDIQQEAYPDGSGRSAWVMRFVENEARGQRVKNEGSERRVPIHSDLMDLGFLKLVERARAAKSNRLFPDIKPNAQGELMGSWSKWFGRYRRQVCGLRGKDTPFHSFRHNFKHYARLASIPAEQHNAITGHETGDVADAYGGLSYPLPPLVEAMEKYRVPSFTLPPPPPL